MTTVRRLYEKSVSSPIFVATMVVAMILFGGVFTHHQTAYAEFCKNGTGLNPNMSVSEINDLYQSNPCFSELNQSISDATGGSRTLTRQQFVDQVHTCLNGNAGGIDNAKTVYSCANAVATCNIKMIDKSNCNANNMADIAQWCNDGKSTNQDNCGRINTSNEATFNSAQEAAKQQALSTCSTSGGAADVVKQQNACADAVLSKCSNPTDTANGMFSKSTYTDYKFGDYQACLGSALKSTAKDGSECSARGGIWIDSDTKDPNGPNTLSKGCYNQASDLTNPQACSAANKGYVWQKTGTNAYGCVDQNAVCKDHGGGQARPDGTCPDGTKAQGSDFAEGVDTKGNPIGTTSQCGSVTTNLIACRKNGPAGQALGDVLKIIISVLTVIIGIAATGGLAWAAILYAKAEDNASNVSEAKTLIRNIVIGILLYGFMVAIVNWLVPGGVIG